MSDSKKWTEINLNSQVKIKLKPKGMIHLLENHKRIVGQYGDYVPRLDKDGFYHTVLWSLISDFGDVFSMTSTDLFDLNVFVDIFPKESDKS